METAVNSSTACPPILSITLNWIELMPFFYLWKMNNISELAGYLPYLMHFAAKKCGCPKMNFHSQRMNISSSEEIEIKIRSSLRTTTPELYFPVFANPKESTHYQRPFLALFKSPGPAIVEIMHGSWKENMSSVNVILETWPILSLCLLFGILAGFIVWAIERRQNPEEFNAKFPHGALDGIWWSFVTMTTVGYGDKTTRTFWGRMFAVFWMVLGTIVMSLFTGQITANITSSEMAPVDLMDTKLAVPKGMKAFIEQEMNLGARQIVEMTYEEMLRIVSNDTTIEYAMIHDYKMAKKWLPSVKDHAKIVKNIDHQFVIGMSITGDYEPVESMLKCFQIEVIDLFEIQMAKKSLKTGSGSSLSTSNQESGLTLMHILLIASGGTLVLCVLLGFLFVYVLKRKTLTPTDLEQGPSTSPFATELPTIQKCST